MINRTIANTKTGKRRSEIIRQLADLSRNGWSNARTSDYQALEAELRDIDEYIKEWRK